MRRLVVLLVALCLSGMAHAAAPPLRVMIVLDDSASMRANDPGGLVKSATRDFVVGLSDADSAGLVVFSGDARLVVPARRLGGEGARAALLSAIDGVAFGGQHTDIGAGVERALYELRDGASGAPATRDAMLVVTDGIIDTGLAARDIERARWLREDLLPDLAARDVRVLGIAFTEKADWALLQQMARATNGAYFRALAREDLAAIFRDARSALEKEAPVAPKPAPPPAQGPRVVMVPTEADQPTGLIILLVTAIVIGLSVILALVLRRDRRGGDAALDTASGGKSPHLPALDEDDSTHGILQDVSTGVRHRLTKSVTTLGRRSDCDVVIDEKTVSGQHAQISRRAGLFYINDLRSTNGTFLNDERVEGERLLRAGDILRFDRRHYRYEGELPEGVASFPDGDGTVLRIAGGD